MNDRLRLAARTLGSLLLGWAVVWGSVILVAKGLSPLIDATFHPGPDLASAIRRACIFLAAVAAYWAYVHWHEKRDATELRLRPVRLLLGGAAGAVLMAIPIAALFAVGAYELVQFRGISSALAGPAVLIVIAATLEELVFRCLLFRVLERAWGTWVALAVQAVLFALQHLGNLGNAGTRDVVVMLVTVTLGGLLWGGVFILTRNLWATAANHAAWNFTILLSGVPLSGNEDWRAISPLATRYAGPDWLTGGMFGPESSLLAIASTTVAVVVLLRVAASRSWVDRHPHEQPTRASATTAAMPNYGLDAPVAVRNLLIVGALGIISLITRLMGVWSGRDGIAVIARPLMVAGLSCGAMALWMMYDSKIGKIRERDTYLDKIAWNGHERVLDVGCGLGLFLIGAAKRLSTGRAVGIDKWQQEDLSGNSAAGALNNAMIEGVADKVDVHTGDARKLPFPDASFDVVLSSMALHNIYDAGERQTALREIARVLAPGGRVLIVDVRHTSEYAATLRNAGLTDARCVQGVFSSLLTLITFGSVGWGYVIASRMIATVRSAPR